MSIFNLVSSSETIKCVDNSTTFRNRQISNQIIVFHLGYGMPTFGEKLLTLRTQHGLTVRQLAAALEIKSPGYITKLEKGRQKPSRDLLLKISLFFEVSADQLLRDDLDLD